MKRSLIKCNLFYAGDKISIYYTFEVKTTSELILVEVYLKSLRSISYPNKYIYIQLD